MLFTKRPLLLSLLVTVLALPRLQAADKDGTLRIGFIGRAGTDPVYQVALAGARRAAIDLAATYETKIKIEDLTPAAGDPKDQVAAIEQLVHEGADGITLACADTDLVAAAIDRAAQAGLQIATFNSDAPNSKRFFSYLADSEQCGQTLVVELAKAMKGKGTIGILAGNTDSVPQKERIQGIQTGAKVYPGLVIKGIYTCKETGPDSSSRLAEVMKANPDITGWVLVGSWPLDAPHAFPWPAGAVKCVAVGILPNQLDYLRTGYVQMVVAQPFYDWGYHTVELLVLRLSLNRKPATPIEYAAITAVTPDNVGDYAKRMTGWDLK